MPVDEQWDNSDVGDPEPEPATAPKRPPMRITRPSKPPTSPPPLPPAGPSPAASPAKPVESSLQLLAKDLMPPARPVELPPPEIPVNFDRTVRALPPWTRAWRWLLHKLRLDRLSPRQRWIVGGVVGALLIGVVAAFATRGGERQGISAAELAQRAHGEVTGGKYKDALASYQALLVAEPGVASDPALVADLGRVADHADAEVSGAALDMLAWQVGGPGYEELLKRTASKSAGVRHHAIALADSEGIGDRVDRVAGWMMDIEQTKSCEQKRALVGKIAAAHDKRLAVAQKEAAKGCGASPVAKTTAAPPAKSGTSTTHHRPKPRW